MFVDASALVAILMQEIGSDGLTERLGTAKARFTSPLAVWESAVALSRGLAMTVRDATAAVETYLNTFGIDVIAVDPEIGRLALTAFDRYGKGRHPASLNFGDCFAYACARQLGLPLLFKGNDFALTDIEAA